MIGHRPHRVGLADVRADEQIAAIGGGPLAVAGNNQPAGLPGQRVFHDQTGAVRRHVPLQGDTCQLPPLNRIPGDQLAVVGEGDDLRAIGRDHGLPDDVAVAAEGVAADVVGLCHR